MHVMLLQELFNTLGGMAHFTLSFISRSPSEAIDTLYGPYFHFCYELALKLQLSKPLRVRDLCHAHH